MQTEKRGKKPIVQRPLVKTLQIMRKYRENKYSTKQVPEIRFHGNWLQKLGFKEGGRVSVTMMNRLLILQVQPEENDSQR